VFLVNTLLPQDGSIVLGEQARNFNQSSYALSFTESSTAAASDGLSWSGFGAAFALGMRHIAEGSDHLLFLLTLLVPAPVFAIAGRWQGRASVRQSLHRILRIVTAFTLGHSITLALAGFGLVRVPSKPIEILIAVSILISAVHACRPLFPGREAAIAAFFGLIHGLAFAATLTQLGLTGWYRLISLLGFNLGIETMQLVVVFVTLPSLLLLSRGQFYSVCRWMGASLGLFASVTWIVERSLDRLNAVATLVEQTAQHGFVFAGALLVLGLLSWMFQRSSSDELSTTE
jgi:hypothetical protein